MIINVQCKQIVSALLCLYPLCAPATSQTYDARVNQVITVSLSSGGGSLTLNPGGRVGNWYNDGSYGTLVFDVNVNSPGNTNVVTTLYTAQVTSSLAGKNALTLNATPVLSGLSNIYGGTLPSNTYVGNGWICPSGDLILFQVSENSSNNGAYNPGAGADNNVWVYQKSTSSISKLTSVVKNMGNGLGPQCSQDSVGPPSNSYHIVYGYLNQPPSNLLPYAPTANCNTIKYSNGTCGWYGDWSLVFADVQFNVGGSISLANATTIKPRSLAANPFAEVASGSGTIGSSGGYTTVSSSQFTSAMNGSGISVTDTVNSNTVLTSITNISGTTATLAYASGGLLGSGHSAAFSVVHNVYYEPCWYASHWGLTATDTNTGQLYVSSNRHLTWHDSVNMLATLSGSPSSPSVALTELTPEPAAAVSYSTTVFNEFGTPSPVAPSSTPFALYMSDAAHVGASGCATAVPECSDLYICALPNCNNQIPVVVPEPGETSPDYTVTRFGWSPDNTHIASLLQHNGSTPTFYIWNFGYPTLEVTGNMRASGNVVLK